LKEKTGHRRETSVRKQPAQNKGRENLFDTNNKMMKKKKVETHQPGKAGGKKKKKFPASRKGSIGK